VSFRDFATECGKVLASDCHERVKEHPAFHCGLDLHDLGAGTGRMAFPLAKLVGKVTALDASSDMVARMRTESRRRGVENIDIVEGRFEDFRFDGMFDFNKARIVWTLSHRVGRLHPRSWFSNAQYSQQRKDLMEVGQVAWFEIPACVTRPTKLRISVTV
jgi:SAM-dependent methyltransferase